MQAGSARVQPFCEDFLLLTNDVTLSGAGVAPVHISSRVLLVRLWRETLGPHKMRFAAAIVCMVLVAGSQAMSAWLMRSIVDSVFIAKNTLLLWPVAGAVLATFTVKGLATYGQGVTMSSISLRIITDLQQRLFAHLLRLDVAFFNKHAAGRLVSRFTVDVISIKNGVSTMITGLGRDSLSVVGLVGVMFYQDWLLASASFIAFPLAVLPVTRLSKRMRRVATNTQELAGYFNAVLEQSFQGIRMVKSYGLESYETEAVTRVNESMFRNDLKAAKVRGMSSPIMEFFGGFAVTIVIVYGGSRVIAGATTTGAFFSFLTALLMAYQPFKSLANFNGALQETLAGATRLFELLDTEPAIKDAPGAVPLVVSGGEIRLENVSFAYGDEGLALDNVTLTVPAGKTAALVGASGGGKTTLMNLVPRFYDVTSGQVLIDGQNIAACTLDSLRSVSALVSQEVVLFDDTVRANIAFGKIGASEAEIVDAARHAAAHDFIMALPQGYDTVVGERGLRLSGGQRQRLAIARAMLRNAPILLLDEATSALDSESERHVQNALESLMQGRTTLVIAHRLSTIVGADVIYVMEGGQVIESGNHADLLALGGAYARLYTIQFAQEQQESQQQLESPVTVDVAGIV